MIGGRREVKVEERIPRPMFWRTRSSWSGRRASAGGGGSTNPIARGFWATSWEQLPPLVVRGRLRPGPAQVPAAPGLWPATLAAVPGRGRPPGTSGLGSPGATPRPWRGRTAGRLAVGVVDEAVAVAAPLAVRRSTGVSHREGGAPPAVGGPGAAQDGRCRPGQPYRRSLIGVGPWTLAPEPHWLRM